MNKSTRFASLVAGAALIAGAGAATAASPAHADSGVWDRVAACESGNNWSINTGNGFYGGLQFTRSTWLAYGGGAYASTANYATKAEQIAIARRVLASQGPTAWPVCSRHAGLTRANGGADSHAMPSGSVTVTHRKSTHKSHPVTSHKGGTTTTTHSTAPKGSYVVKAGDSLSKIARAHGTTWQKLWAANKATVKNPNLIRVGQVLVLK